MKMQVMCGSASAMEKYGVLRKLQQMAEECGTACLDKESDVEAVESFEKKLLNLQSEFRQIQSLIQADKRAVLTVEIHVR